MKQSVQKIEGIGAMCYDHVVEPYSSPEPNPLRLGLIHSIILSLIEK